MSRKHVFLPDCQIRPGDDVEFLSCIGRFIVAKQPDVVVCIGDFADMPSLSSYDRGKKSFEGRRYKSDIQSVHKAMEALLTPLWEFQDQQRKEKTKIYRPTQILTYGNHENRIMRAIEDDAKLEGTIGLEDLNYEHYGWKTVPFLEAIVIDGVAYSHYFPSGVKGLPVSNAKLLLNKMHMSCIAGHQQGRDIAYAKRPDGTSLTGIIAGSCLTPDHEVLKADLTYVPLGNIKVGDKLVSFDEEVVNKRSRRYKTGTVEAVKLEYKETFEVLLESGQIFTATADHRWLVKTGSNYHWRTTDSLRKGTCIPKLFNVWGTETSFDAGWLSGIYDGEGSLSQRHTTGGTCMQLAVSQKAGGVLDKIKELITSYFEYPATVCPTGRDVHQLRIKGGTKKIAEFLGRFRPLRLLNKFKPEFLGRINSPDSNNDKVVSITPVGSKQIVQIQIDAKTMIVEGYPHHNCYEHDEDYLSPQTNQHYRGLYVLHQVENGSFDEMAVSLQFLKERYGK